MAPSAVSPDPTPVATLRIFRPGVVDVAAVATVLRVPTWLGEQAPHADTGDGLTTYLTDLVLPLPPDGRLLSLRKAAYVDLGRISETDGRLEAEIAWRSASLAPLFPVFAGRLTAKSSGLLIEGHYAPPGGRIGLVADRALLNVAARGTARWFLDHVAAQARTIAGSVTGG